MQIGNLPRSRSRTPAGLLNNGVVQAMGALLTIGFLVTGWLAWPSTQSEAPAAPKARATVRPTSDPAVQNSVPLPRVASADPAAAPSSATPFVKEFSEAAPPSQPTEGASAPEPSASSVAVAPEAQAGAPQRGTSTAPVMSEITGALNTDADKTTEPETESGLVDLNTASFEELNSLKGAGPIGRAIIKGRPYASTEDLVKKKVLRRPIYEKIKDQVTVEERS